MQSEPHAKKRKKEGGVVLQKILFVFVDVPAGLQNFDFYYTYICPHIPPSPTRKRCFDVLDLR